MIMNGAQATEPSVNEDKNLLLVFDDADPVKSGHNANYLCYLLEYWARVKPRRRMAVAIYSSMADIHPRLGALLKETEDLGVEVIDLERRCPGRAKGQKSKRNSALLLKECVETYKPARCLLMYLDQFRVPLALGLRFATPVELSGIYFLPTFHYRELNWGRATVVERFRQWRNKMLMLGAMRNKHLTTIFCLDRYSIGYIKALNSNTQVLDLRDPVEVSEIDRHAVANLRRRLRIKDGAKVGLMFGALGPNKGVAEALRAVLEVPRATAERLSLLLAGRIEERYKGMLESLIARVRARGCQVIVVDKLIEEKKINSYYGLADMVLLPYHRHAGSSGGLMRAAAAGKPVIGSDYGLIGELIRRNRLGLAIDSRSPSSIAAAVERIISGGELPEFDRSNTLAFARDHSSDRFGATIFSTLLPCSQDGRSAQSA